MKLVDVVSMYVGVEDVIAHLYNEGQIQELSDQELNDEESMLGSAPPSLCSGGVTRLMVMTQLQHWS